MGASLSVIMGGSRGPIQNGVEGETVKPPLESNDGNLLGVCAKVVRYVLVAFFFANQPRPLRNRPHAGQNSGRPIIDVSKISFLRKTKNNYGVLYCKGANKEL